METMFLLVNSLDQSLTLSVCDRHEHWKDTVLGSTTFHLGQLAEDTIQGGIHLSFSKDGKNRGELMFDVIYYPVLKPDEGQDASECIHSKLKIPALEHRAILSSWHCPSDHPRSERLQPQIPLRQVQPLRESQSRLQ